MSGAPVLSGTAGTLIAVLDACLVNGFGSVTLNSLVVQNNVATATVSGGHGFAMIVGVNNVSPGVGPVVRIDGATPAALNGDWRLASVPNSTTFTFAAEGIPDQTATGTITAKRAPAGWAKAFGGANKAAYQPMPAASLLRLDDQTGTAARGVGYESMTDIDTGDGPFPTGTQFSGGYYWPKANTSANRAWRVYADPRAFYYCADNYGNSTWYTSCYFGDVASVKSPDLFGCGHVAGNSDQLGQTLQQLASSSANSGVLARGHNQLTSSRSTMFSRRSHSKSGGLMGGNGSAYPSPADGGLLLAPVEVWDADSSLRGFMPGLYNPVHAQNPPDLTLVDSWPELPGRQLLAQAVISGRYVFDIAGPWR